MYEDELVTKYIFEITIEHFDFELPTLIKQPAGYEIKLQCGIRNEHTEFMSSSDVYWDFKV